ncbi:hypothetical protein [Nocardioides sp. LHG3406-4]|uniref:hypothetical protein n=1 Tax=Nocardioides sp. LHG3406-4 TaxID=2804575 RepID=UPI003CE890DA
MRIHWKASPDDVTALAISLGALDQMRTFVFDDGVMVPEESDETDGVKLAKAPELGTYLLKHVAVTVDGTACTGKLLDVDDVIAQGATVDFDCGSAVTSADVRIDTLTDINAAYRTMGYGPGDVINAYSQDSPVFTWQFSKATQPGTVVATGGGRAGSAVLQLGGIGAALAAAGCTWWLLVRRRANRDRGLPSPAIRRR